MSNSNENINYPVVIIEENHPIDALQQAEFYKNRCLTWILDTWQENPASPDYQRIQTLIDSQTAIIYWHLSSDNLTTFIITTTSDLPLILECDRRQQASQFEEWRLEWDTQYRDYATKKTTANEKRDQHPWRVTLAIGLPNSVNFPTSPTIGKKNLEMRYQISMIE